MRTATHVFLAIGGALVGATVAGDSPTLFASLVGGLAGLAIGEVAFMRRRLQEQAEELRQLRADVQARGAQPAAPRPVAAASAPEASAFEAAFGAATPAPVAAAPAPVSTPPAAADIQRAPWAPVATAAAAATQAPAAAVHQPTPADETFAAMPRQEYVSQELVLVRAIRNFFTGGNTLVRAGVIVLFFGVAFLLRYLAEHTHVPIEFRLAGVALGAVALLVVGWRLRLKRAGYALALQGGAVGILYLTVFAALRLYGLLSPAIAFPLLVLFAALFAVLAVLQNSQAFALLGVAGGFLAPILASTGQGSHVVLFSYYAILNAGILGIAWFKSWRPLNVCGFLFTFAISTAWGVLRYKPELLASTEPFLVLFFLFYVAIAVLFSLRQEPQLNGYVDGTLVFGTPLAAFGLQTALLHDQRMQLAFSALAVSALYLDIAWLLQRRRSGTQRLLIEAFLALGVVFLTLAVPLALNGHWSAAAWALEGAALVWIGCRQQRVLARAFGALLQIAAGGMIVHHLDLASGSWLWPNGLYLSGLLVAAASVLCAHLLHSAREQLKEYEQWYAVPLFCWGLFWWLASGFSELQRRVPSDYLGGAVLGFMSATALLCSELYRRLDFAFARVPALLLLPGMALCLLYSAGAGHHPLEFGGWVYWPLAFLAFYVIASRHEGPADTGLASALHASSLWLLLGAVSWETTWQIQRLVGARGSWSGIAWALVPAAALFLLPALVRRVTWPFATHRRSYLATAGTGIAAYLCAWMLAVNVLMHGDSYPLPYVPLLNPLDLALGFALLVLIRHAAVLRAAQFAGDQSSQHIAMGGLAILGFVSLNGALFRALHHLAGVPFSLPGMLHSTLVQTSLSIFWAVLALTTMLFATRRSLRIVWLCGAALLGVVVAKLFLVDLSSIGSIERIVSFVGVGLLMLVLGYFSPLPPAVEEQH